MGTRAKSIVNAPRIHQVNQTVVLRDLALHGALSCTHFARRFNVPVGTIQRIVQRLAAMGLVVTRKGDPSGRVGKPPTLVDLHAAFGSFIGVELGSATTRSILVDFKGNLLAAELNPTSALLPDIGRTLPAYLAAFLTRHGGRDGHGPLAGVAIGVSGTVSPDDGGVSQGFLPVGTRLCPPIEDRLRVPALVDNDANLAALAESLFGAARETDHAICVLDRGWVGAGLWLNGAIYLGRRNCAGELTAGAWTQSGPRKARGATRFPFVGSFELEHLLRNRRLRTKPYACRTDLVSALARRADEGDPGARRVIEGVAMDFACAFVRLGGLFDPDGMILAGDFVASGALGEKIFQREFARQWRMTSPPSSGGEKAALRVAFSRIDQNIVARGAAAMIVNEVTARRVGNSVNGA